MAPKRTNAEFLEMALEAEDFDEAELEIEASELDAAAERSTVVRYFIADHNAVRTVNELKDLMRATADHLEIEAARLRNELEVLELTTQRTSYH